ncbi:Ashwin [Operophtera brumata]|uniref:Ashwin n=1 Tax=Operophtera brumata TaxID=104452 RepID=A0A0L7KZ00_OPEBR|nr:Ashwin [Operophtera brumata]
MAIPCEMLLYPELLSNNQLISIIQERHLRVENIERMSRCDLIELFRNYCLPYGQRKYRDSGRGKVLNKTRHCCPEPAAKLNVFSNNQCSKVSRSNCDRIKPPPDILSGHMKRIKLDHFVSDVNNSKRKMSIDSDTEVKEGPALKKEKKPITWP